MDSAGIHFRKTASLMEELNYSLSLRATIQYDLTHVSNKPSLHFRTSWRKGSLSQELMVETFTEKVKSELKE